jgi:hypothetical protein
MAGENTKLRAKLFDDYSDRLVAVGGDKDTFVCPICLKSFGRDALMGENPMLTLGHVLPEALGGSFCTLSCAPCNNDMGSDLEAFLLERFRAEDALNGIGNLAGRLEGDFGSVGVEFQAAPPGEPWTVLIIERQTNPSVLKNLNAALDAEVGGNAAHVVARINPRFRNKPNRVSAALYQSAYLLMFAYFGYEFAFDPRFTKLRQQILDPDAAILPGEFDMPPDAWADALLPDAHGIMLVKQPSSFIMPVFRLYPDGGTPRLIGVPLPGLNDTNWPPTGARGKVKVLSFGSDARRMTVLAFGFAMCGSRRRVCHS